MSEAEKQAADAERTHLRGELEAAIANTNRLTAENQSLREAVARLLPHAYSLRDVTEYGWCVACRECRGTSPLVEWKRDAKAEDVRHEAGCFVGGLGAPAEHGGTR